MNKYYVFIQNNKINGKGNCRCLNDDIQNIEVSEEVYNDLDRYMWDGSDIVINPNYDSEQLTLAKANKKQEAIDKANEYINTEALCPFNEYHIEATDGNIAKLTAYLIAIQTGTIQTVFWNTKEDVSIELSADDLKAILMGIATIQSGIWNDKYPRYINAIESCLNADEVNAIVIDYSME